MRIIDLEVRPLTKPAFAPFGDVIETEGAEMRLINNGTTLPMTGTMAGCALAGLVVLLLGKKHLGRTGRIENVQQQAFEQVEKY